MYYNVCSTDELLEPQIQIVLLSVMGGVHVLSGAHKKKRIGA